MNLLTVREVAVGSFYAFIVGAALSALYDVFRVLRLLLGLRPSPKETPRKTLPLVGEIGASRLRDGFFSAAVTFVTDLMFFAVATAAYLVLVFHSANGQNRWFLTLAALFGFLAYHFTIGKLVMKASGAIRFALSAAIAYLLFFAALPFRSAYKYALVPAARSLSKKIAEKRTKKARKALAKNLIIVYNICVFLFKFGDKK